MLPGITDKVNAESTSATVTFTIVKDASVSVSKSFSSNEIDFGTGFTVTCSAEGGRIPFFLETTHKKPGDTAGSQLVFYDLDTSKVPSSVTIDNILHALSYVYTVASAGYDNIGDYKCVGKNRASGDIVVETEGSVTVHVGRSTSLFTFYLFNAIIYIIFISFIHIQIFLSLL